MGNFVLRDLIDQGPGMRTVSLPRGSSAAVIHGVPSCQVSEARVLTQLVPKQPA